MAKVELHPLIKQIRGKLYGDLVLKLSPQGELIIAKRPDMSKVRWSRAQKAHRQRFKQAVEGAKAALADPAMRLKYERMAKKQHKRLWDVAFSDHFHGKDLPPQK
jgi:hypothetical protein